MTGKEALKELLLMINREKHINSEWNKKICNLERIIKNDLEILEIQRLVQKQTLENIVKEGMEEMELPKAVNTSEALDYLKRMSNKYQMIRYPGVSNLTIDGYYEQVKQDLERLEKLEKEHEKLKERYKHRAETSNDLCKAVKQYEKAIEILVEELKISVIEDKQKYDFVYYWLALNGIAEKEIIKEQFELLKGVL